MKKLIIFIGITFSIGLFITGCFSSKNGNLPPMLYDYEYRFDEKGYSERYVHGHLINSRGFVEHKHEIIKFDYRAQ